MVTYPQPVALTPDEPTRSPAPAAKSTGIRFRSLDAWRGLACIAVVLHHGSGDMMLRDPSLASIAIFKACHCGYYGVAIFFVISGYCIANSACVDIAGGRGLGYFAWTRMRRILPPYWLSALAYALLKLILLLLFFAGFRRLASLASDHSLRGDFLFYFSNATLTQYIFHRTCISPVFWTLCYEAAFYVMVGGAMLIGRRNRNVLLNVLHGVTLFCIVVSILGPVSALCYPLDLWPQFGLGILVYDFISSSGTASRRAGVWGAIIYAGFIVEALLHKFAIYTQAGTGTFLTAMAFSILLVLLYRVDLQLVKNRAVALLSKAGKFSYSLYLTHYFILAMLLKLIPSSLLSHHPYAILLLLLAVPLAFAPLFYRAFEQPFLAPRQ